MSIRSRAAVQAGLLLMALFANAVSKNAMRIRVLDSETRAASLDYNGVPQNCDQVNFDAHCRSSMSTPLTSTLLVQEGDRPPFRITCTIASKYSRCRSLPIGETFDARREKHGITVYYVDDNGRLRKQFYTFVAANTKSGLGEATAPVAVQSAVAPAQNAVRTPVASIATSGTGEVVKCSFASIPAGAEVTLDGRYVGSTPSTVGVTTGSHVVVISMPGFAQWKREFAVTSGSELTVNAVLQKLQ